LRVIPKARVVHWQGIQTTSHWSSKVTDGEVGEKKKKKKKKKRVSSIKRKKCGARATAGALQGTCGKRRIKRNNLKKRLNWGTGKMGRNSEGITLLCY